MSSYPENTKKTGIAETHAPARISKLPSALMLLFCLALAAPLHAAASGQQSPTAHIAVHPERVLVRSFMGYGVQLDPYEYPPSDAQWKLITHRLDLLRPAFFRVMFRTSAYCLRLDDHGCAEYVWQKGTPAPTTQYGQILRILDYAQAHNTPVMIGEWSWPNLPHAPSVRRIAGPDDPRWPEIIAPLLLHLVREGHYTVLRYYNYMNEPNGAWMWPGGQAGVNYAAWVTGFIHARQVFDRAGLQNIRLVGPDNSGDWDWIDKTLRDARQVVSGWEMHWYPKDDEVASGAVYRLLLQKRQLIDSDDAAFASKKLFLGEAGLITGRVNGDQQPRVRTFQYGVKMADYAVQVAQAGWMGASAWDLDDAMHAVKDVPPVPGPLTLKTWGFWNSEGPAMGTPDDLKIRSWFTVWRSMTHLFPPKSEIVQVTAPDRSDGLRSIASKSIADGKTIWSVVVVNDSASPRNLVLRLPGPPALRWRSICYCRNSADANGKGDTQLQPIHTSQSRFTLVVDADSVVFLTTGELN